MFIETFDIVFGNLTGLYWLLGHSLGLLFKYSALDHHKAKVYLGISGLQGFDAWEHVSMNDCQLSLKFQLRG